MVKSPWRNRRGEATAVKSPFGSRRFRVSQRGLPARSPCPSRGACGVSTTPVRESCLRRPTQEESKLGFLPRPCAEVACGSESPTPVRKSRLCTSHEESDQFSHLGHTSRRHAHTVWPVLLNSCNSHANPGLGGHWWLRIHRHARTVWPLWPKPCNSLANPGPRNCH